MAERIMLVVVVALSMLLELSLVVVSAILLMMVLSLILPLVIPLAIGWLPIPFTILLGVIGSR